MGERTYEIVEHPNLEGIGCSRDGKIWTKWVQGNQYLRTYLGDEWRELTGTVSKHGYIKVGITIRGVKGLYSAHRLVATVFIPNPENKECIDHINTIRTDNRVENLRWATRKENSNNPISRQNNSRAHIGRVFSAETREKIRQKCLGVKNHNYGEHPSEETLKKRSVSLKVAKRKQIGQYHPNGDLVKIWSSALDVETALGYCRSCLSLCCNGKQKLAYGYMWKFV